MESNDKDEGSNKDLQTWTFVNPMKNEVTTVPPLCLECSEVLLELNKRHQAYLETWRFFQDQIKFLHSRLVEKENVQRYKKFEESLECAENLDISWKQKTRIFLESLRRKVDDTDDPGSLSETMGDQLESCDKEVVVDVKEESLDDAIIEDRKCEAEVEYTGTSDVASDSESIVIDDEMETQAEAGCYDERFYDNDNDDDEDIGSEYEPSPDNTDSSRSASENEEELISFDQEPICINSTLQDPISINSSLQEPVTIQTCRLEPVSINTSLQEPETIQTCRQEPVSINTSLQQPISKSTSRRKTPVVKRNVIEDDDDDPFISSKKYKTIITQEVPQSDPLLPLSEQVRRTRPKQPQKIDPNRCHLCNFIVLPPNKKRHYATRHRNHPYNCDICGFNIPPEEFPSHLEAHVGDYVTKCTNSSCSYVAINPSRLWKLHLSRRNEACKDAGGKYSEFCTKARKNCEYCNQSLTGKSSMSLSRHVIDCHETQSIVKPFPCPVETCEKAFAYRESVQLHLSDHALSTLIFEEQPCSVCYKLYMPPNVLTGHLKGFHKFSEIIKCVHCPYVFGTRKHLLDHMCQFHVKTMEGIPCDICKDKDPTKYTTLAHFREHYSQAHQIGAPLVCDKCGFSTFTEINFHFHKLDHDKYKLQMPKDLIKCEMCEEKFLTKLKQWVHMRDIHNEIRPHPSELNKKKIRQYACKSCDQLFDTRPLLFAHRQSAHPKTHVCESCGKNFHSSKAMAIHQKLHKGERPFVCEVCSHAFAQQGDLNSHMRIHTGERPYKCSMCSESFRQRTGLRKHSLAVHQIDKTYVCSRDPKCGKSFTTYKELTNHEIREHENVCHLCTEERKEFGTRKELHMHLRNRHRNSFSIKCDQCETLCSSQAGLEVHCRIKHT